MVFNKSGAGVVRTEVWVCPDENWADLIGIPQANFILKFGSVRGSNCHYGLGSTET